MSDYNLMSAHEAEEERLFLEKIAPPQNKAVTAKPGKAPKLSNDEFSYYLRVNPELFWKRFRKPCSCPSGDLRLETDGFVECGACCRRLVAV